MQELTPSANQPGFTGLAIRIIEHLKTILAIGFVIQVALGCFRTITAYDFPWQLAEGDFILHHGYAPRSVLQSYGEISPHFTNEYIPYEIVIAAIDHIAGWLGLSLFFAIIALIIYMPCLVMFVAARGRYSLMAAFIFMVSLEVIDWRLSARPELIADACYITVGMALLRHREFSWNWLQLFGFGVIFSIWANVHGTFLIGLGMVGLWYGQTVLLNWKSIISRMEIKWLWPGVAAVIGSAVNPFGFHRFIQPFELHGLLWGQGTSPEMWPVPLDQSWVLLTGTVAGLFALLRRIREQKNYWIIALLCILQYLSFTSNRFSIFIGLTLLMIVWHEVRHSRQPYQPTVFPLFSALGKVSFYFILTLFYAEFIFLLINAMLMNVHKQGQYMYPHSLVSINSSLAWLRAQPKPDYILFSQIYEGSLSQMPGCDGIRPMIDSGTHRYSNEINEFYYYTIYDPDTIALALSRLKINAIILDRYTACWAVLLNRNPEWNLVEIGPDSQLYLHANNRDLETRQKKIQDWEKLGPASFTSEVLFRGLNLRPDEDSLRMLESLEDQLWTYDPQITYLKVWLGQVPDDLVRKGLHRLGGRMDNPSAALHVLYALRLQKPEEAVNIALKWDPRILDKGYQQFQELRAEAFLAGGNTEVARTILNSLWPLPRYSLRWGRLCQQAYAGQPVNEPEDARLLTGLEQSSAWKDDIITRLNQNILRISVPQP